ncbi:MAG: SPASM domain-containing protein [Candidatus Omnitrophica bacterium]|nr:SPASM domain-containing protein [Candidatus Omnitrophota bacterium]
MEFTALNRYYKIKNGNILPFSELRKLRPLLVGQDLKIVNDKENIAYAEQLAKRGMEVVPIRKNPIFPGFLKREDFPRRVIMEMTSRCNFLCRMCPQQNLKRPRMDMPGEKYRRIIDEIDVYGIEGLWLYHLGEALLHPEFCENIKHINKKNNLGVIWMSTNGRNFTEEYIKLVLDSNIDFINYSAHAVTERTYNTVAPEGNFSFVQDNLENLYRLKGLSKEPKKPFLHVQMIEQETTKHEVDDFIKKHYLRAEIVSVNMLEYANMPNNVFGAQQRNRAPLSSCVRVSRNDCFVFSNGEVTLCDFAYNGELSLGNINEETLYQIWNGDRRKFILNLNEKKKMSNFEFCSRCTDYDI